MDSVLLILCKSLATFLKPIVMLVEQPREISCLQFRSQPSCAKKRHFLTSAVCECTSSAHTKFRMFLICSPTYSQRNEYRKIHLQHGKSCEMIDVKCRTNEGLSLKSNLHLTVSLTQLFVSLDLPHLLPAGYAATFPCEFANDSSAYLVTQTNTESQQVKPEVVVEYVSIESPKISWDFSGADQAILGSARGNSAPSQSIFFIFMQFSAKLYQLIGWHPLWENLDPHCF